MLRISASLRGQTRLAFASFVSLLLFTLVFVSSALAAPTVSNVRAAQRPGTNLVDVNYDLAGAETGGASVSVALSGDAGASYGLPVTTLSGDIGSGVRNALNLRIVWDAGADVPDFTSAAMRLRVIATSAPPRTGFTLIPAGSFQMGDSFAEGRSEELPVHTVYVSAFYMGRTEVTYAHWQEVRTWALSNGYVDLFAGSGKGDKHPVQSVSWYDVVKWCNAASERDGLAPVYRASDGGVYRSGEIDPVINYAHNGYRLPTEAEWEKAARGGLNGQRFPWGATITHAQANYFSYAGSIYYVDAPTQTYDLFYDVSATRGYHPSIQNVGAPFSSPHTMPIGGLAPNGYGLYDMVGNVWEWCNDWGEYYLGVSTRDPSGPSSGNIRVFRGGCYADFALVCRVASRAAYVPAQHSGDIGFRIARSL